MFAFSNTRNLTTITTDEYVLETVHAELVRLTAATYPKADPNLPYTVVALRGDIMKILADQIVAISNDITRMARDIDLNPDHAFMHAIACSMTELTGVLEKIADDTTTNYYFIEA